MNELAYKIDLSIRYSRALADSVMSQYLSAQLQTIQRIINGHPYITATYYVPNELLALFDINTVFIERITGLGTASNLRGKLYLCSSYQEIPRLSCSYQQFFKNLIDHNILPCPDFFIAASFACDDAWMFARSFSRRKQIPFYLLDVLKQRRDVSVAYLQEQLEELYRILRARYPEIHSTAEVVERSNQAARLKGKIDAIRYEYPGIMPSMDAFKLFTVYNDFGSVTAVDVYKELLGSLERKRQNYQRPGSSKILWLGMLPLYKNRFLHEIEEKYDCCIVFEELFNSGSTEITAATFFRDVSERIVQNLFYSIDTRVAAITKYHEIFGLDGIIHFSQHNCRFLPPQLPVLYRKTEQLSIPMVEIHGDVINPEYFHEAGCYQKLDVFFETIQMRQRRIHVG